MTAIVCSPGWHRNANTPLRHTVLSERASPPSEGIGAQPYEHGFGDVGSYTSYAWVLGCAVLNHADHETRLSNEPSPAARDASDAVDRWGPFEQLHRVGRGSF